jgi:hypothetical protein
MHPSEDPCVQSATGTESQGRDAMGSQGDRTGPKHSQSTDIIAYVGGMWCRRGGWWRSLATGCMCGGMEAGDDVEVVLPQKNSVVWSRKASSEKAHPVRATSHPPVGAPDAASA